jgi:pimeloyl-ACP methyl ester carboxylesterase
MGLDRIELMSILAFILIALLLISVSLWLLARKSQQQKIAPPDKRKAFAEFVPSSQFVSVNGRQVHYVQAGNGPDLVLLHGIGASIFIWRFIFPLLSASYRLTAIDLPGFGKSERTELNDYSLDFQAQTIMNALSELNINQPVLIGSSMGGAIALWMSKLAPDRFSDIIALAPATDHKLAPRFAYRLGFFSGLFKALLNRFTMRLILKRVVTRHEMIDTRMIDSYLRPFQEAESAMKPFWAATKILSDRRLPRDLHNVKARTLIIYGDRDRLVPITVVQNLAAALPNATLLIHLGGGHHIMEDEPAWTAEAIVNFATRT